MIPVDAVHAAAQGHQEPVPHRQLQLLSLCDDQHVWPGQGRAQVVQVDPAVVGHQADTHVQRAVTLLPTVRTETQRRILEDCLCYLQLHTC